jgi:choline dehydrogenase-like flavoprotein
MIIDFRNLADGTSIDTDLCIIGAGPAGITLAREFIGTDVRVCLLESGGEEPEEETQDLCDGETVGLPYFPLDGTRIRTLGGPSYHWMGRCGRLLPIEMEERDWVPYSGWPIQRASLEPFYRKAHKICELGDYFYGSENWQQLGFPEPDFDSKKVQARFWRISPPTRFGPKYRNALEKASNTSVYLNASVTNIQASVGGDQIERVDIRTLEGTSGSVTAQVFVLASGGMDNPRLMLASNKVEPAGLGNRHDLVGRFFMEHLEDVCADVVAADAPKLVRMFGKNRTGPVTINAGLCPSEPLQRDRRILSGSMSVEYISDLNSGVGAAKSVVTDMQKGIFPDNVGTKLWQILSDLDEVAPAAYERLVKGEPLVSGIKSMFLWARQEQAPNPNSRITLSQEKDAVGLTRVRLDWQVTELDKLPDWLMEEGKDWTPKMHGGNHHMGTTRMADNPKKGVVDRNCQVHGIENMYVAGSSVFSTSGYVNPTLTIVALSLRLADHLKARQLA